MQKRNDTIRGHQWYMLYALKRCHSMFCVKIQEGGGVNAVARKTTDHVDAQAA
jgi:hypothetical protein